MDEGPRRGRSRRTDSLDRHGTRTGIAGRVPCRIGRWRSCSMHRIALTRRWQTTGRGSGSSQVGNCSSATASATTERGSYGDLAERAGSSLAPDRCEVLSKGRDPDSTDAPDTAGSLVPAERPLPRTIKDFDVVDGEEQCSGPSSSTRRGTDPAVSGGSGSSAFRRCRWKAPSLKGVVERRPGVESRSLVEFAFRR